MSIMFDLFFTLVLKTVIPKAFGTLEFEHSSSNTRLNGRTLIREKEKSENNFQAFFLSGFRNICLIQ
jgi:hypothetical protein